MRDTFVRTLIELAKADPNIELITGDLGFGVLKPFWEQCPDQFTNAGIAEQNMTTVAVWLSREKPSSRIRSETFPRCAAWSRSETTAHITTPM